MVHICKRLYCWIKLDLPEWTSSLNYLVGTAFVHFLRLRLDFEGCTTVGYSTTGLLCVSGCTVVVNS